MNLPLSEPLEETENADDSRQWQVEKVALIARHDEEIVALQPYVPIIPETLFT